MSEWAEFILNYRKAHNMTRNQLADKLKLSPISIRDWEYDKKYPNHSLERRVRAFLNSGL